MQLFLRPEIFQSLQKVSEQKNIPEDERDRLMKLGLIKQVFGGALLLTEGGRERLDNLNRIEQPTKDKNQI
jgi:hypothetical protein